MLKQNTFPFLEEDSWKAVIRNRQREEFLRKEAVRRTQHVNECVQLILTSKENGSLHTTHK